MGGSRATLVGERECKNQERRLFSKGIISECVIVDGDAKDDDMVCVTCEGYRCVGNGCREDQEL